MQCLEIENQIQLAYILKEAVESLDKNLDEVEQGERGLGRGADEDEVEGSVVAIRHQRRSIGGLLGSICRG